jgi:hypothetical protein
MELSRPQSFSTRTSVIFDWYIFQTILKLSVSALISFTPNPSLYVNMLCSAVANGPGSFMFCVYKSGLLIFFLWIFICQNKRYVPTWFDCGKQRMNKTLPSDDFKPVRYFSIVLLSNNQNYFLLFSD